MDKTTLINVGNGNYVNASRILTVASLKSLSIKRAMDDAKASGLLLDFSGHDAAKAVILMDSGVMIRTSLRSQDIQRNVNQLDS